MKIEIENGYMIDSFLVDGIDINNKSCEELADILLRVANKIANGRLKDNDIPGLQNIIKDMVYWFHDSRQRVMIFDGSSIEYLCMTTDDKNQ